MECDVESVRSELIARPLRVRLAVNVSWPETSSCETNAFAFLTLLAPIARVVPSRYLLSFSLAAKVGWGESCTKRKCFTFPANDDQSKASFTCAKFIFLLSRRRVADFRSSSSSESR